MGGTGIACADSEGLVHWAPFGWVQWGSPEGLRRLLDGEAWYMPWCNKTVTRAVGVEEKDVTCMTCIAMMSADE